MEIKNIGYNIGEITISTSLTASTKTEVGTKADFDKIANIGRNSGIARINMTLGGVAMSGVCFLNPYKVGTDIGVDVGSVTNFGGSANAVTGTFTLESNKLYAIVAVTPIGSQQAAKSTKATGK